MRSQAAPEFSWCLKGPLKAASIDDMLKAHMAEPAMALLKFKIFLFYRGFLKWIFQGKFDRA